MKWGSISSHEPDDDGGEGRDEWEDWERSEGRDSGESMPTPVLEKNWEERGVSGEECSHLDGGGGKGVPDSLPAPTLKGSLKDTSPAKMARQETTPQVKCCMGRQCSSIK